MKIKLGNWIINFSAHPKWYEFWWTKQHEIRLANSTTAVRDENGKTTVIREFFTAKALIYGAYYLAEKRIIGFLDDFQTKLVQPEFALRLAIPLALMWVTRVPLVVFGIIEYQTDTDGGISFVSTTLTFSHTTPSGNERLTVVTGGILDDNIDSISYGGVGMSLFTNGFITGCGIAYQIAPNTGAQDCSITRSGGGSQGVLGTAISLTGAHQTVVSDGTQNSGVQGKDGSVNLTTTEEGVMVFGTYGNRSMVGHSSVATNNLTDIRSYYSGSQSILFAYDYKETAGQVTMTTTASGSSGFSASQLQGFRSATPPVSTSTANFFSVM